MDPVAEEAFRQRLLRLAAENDALAAASEQLPEEAERPGPQAGDGGEGQDLEDLARELLAALNRERPRDPLPADEAAALQAAATEAVVAAAAAAAPSDAGGVVPGQAEGAAGDDAPAPTPMVRTGPPPTPSGSMRPQGDLAAAVAAAAAALRSMPSQAEV